jgi:hypothetical protein
MQSKHNLFKYSLKEAIINLIVFRIYTTSWSVLRKFWVKAQKHYKMDGAEKLLSISQCQTTVRNVFFNGCWTVFLNGCRTVLFPGETIHRMYRNRDYFGTVQFTIRGGHLRYKRYDAHFLRKKSSVELPFSSFGDHLIYILRKVNRLTTSFSGGRSWSTRREPFNHGQATGKLYHLRLRVECTLYVIYKAGCELGV